MTIKMVNDWPKAVPSAKWKKISENVSRVIKRRQLAITLDNFSSVLLVSQFFCDTICYKNYLASVQSLQLTFNSAKKPVILFAMIPSTL